MPGRAFALAGVHARGLGDAQLVDCRFRLGEHGAGRVLFREGHIPGARYLDLDDDLHRSPDDLGRGADHRGPDLTLNGRAVDDVVHDVRVLLNQ